MSTHRSSISKRSCSDTSPIISRHECPFYAPSPMPSPASTFSSPGPLFPMSVTSFGPNWHPIIGFRSRYEHAGMIDENGRHPLQELVVERFIPNSVTMTPETPSIIILTGPNSSGKSVLLKQIGTQNPPNFTQLSSCT